MTVGTLQVFMVAIGHRPSGEGLRDFPKDLASVSHPPSRGSLSTAAPLAGRVEGQFPLRLQLSWSQTCSVFKVCLCTVRSVWTFTTIKNPGAPSLSILLLSTRALLFLWCPPSSEEELASLLRAPVSSGLLGLVNSRHDFAACCIPFWTQCTPLLELTSLQDSIACMLITSDAQSGEGNGTPLQYSCLENPIDGRAWWASVHGIAESDTTEQLHFYFSLLCIGEGNGNLLQCSCLENPGTREPGGLPSVGSHRVGHD
ncbi:uncharacterized protein LOC129650563 [Bubalus kerabau]|uniref:uncharacterized protein LOC129650563 n=1 Tax=Bubalus carabanensis TaxID=3119969 RepID=UPI00244E61FE|nr:uncharacterized protein LOC129650563 [Bubalus carabanensis]